jgi:hypothetical protein
MNGIDTVAITVKSKQIQVPLTYPICCDTFYPFRAIKTGLGDGNVITAEHDMKSDKMVVELEYGYELVT